MVLVVIWEMKQGEIHSERRDPENLRKGLIFGLSTRQQIGVGGFFVVLLVCFHFV